MIRLRWGNPGVCLNWVHYPYPIGFRMTRILCNGLPANAPDQAPPRSRLIRMAASLKIFCFPAIFGKSLMQ